MTTTRHGKKGDTESTRHNVRNSDERDRFIKAFGEEKFKKVQETDKRFAKLKDPDIPVGCNWIFSQFLYLYFNTKADGMTGRIQLSFIDINEYQKCMKVPLTVAEKKLLIKMAHWAGEEISELETPSDSKELKKTDINVKEK